MRHWNFGLYAEQHSAISYQQISGNSIVVYGSTTNAEQTIFNVDGTDYTMMVFYSSNTQFRNLLVTVAKALLKAKLGQIPVLVRVDWSTVSYNTAPDGMTASIYRFINGREPTRGDASNRYRDRTSLITFYKDAYAPVFGQDVEMPPAFYETGISLEYNARTAWDVTSIFERALRDNVDVDFMLEIKGLGGNSWQTTYSPPGVWPYFDFYYFLPIEFYKATAGGEIDLLSTVDDQPGSEYYLNAVERGQTGTPVKGFFRNMTGETKQVELFDDHPESEVPVQRAGTGTGELDYVTMADNAVSQLYTVEFYSSTQYEVKAEAYRDNEISLHPQINADASWRGTVGADFTAPSGGLTIPAAAWQPGTLTGDEIEVGVRGNTTDETWPADSNDQVEFTFDDSGSPDNTAWRKVSGRRIRSTASATIDATTKLIPTDYVLPTDWPIGTKAFIQDTDKINHGQVKSVQQASLGAAVHSGTGTDDVTFSGNYNGTITDDYVVEIDAAGTPGTFKWSRNGGTSFAATGIVPTGSPQLLENGIYVTVPASTARVLGDTWTSAVTAFAVELEGLTANSNAYSPNAIVGTTLPFRDVPSAFFAKLTAPAGPLESPASRIWLDDTSGLSAGATILIQQTSGLGLSEEATISTVTTEYIDVTADLSNNYSTGDIVTEVTSGGEAFWMRVVASETTVEQLKELRLNARIL